MISKCYWLMCTKDFKGKGLKEWKEKEIKEDCSLAEVNFRNCNVNTVTVFSTLQWMSMFFR